MKRSLLFLPFLCLPAAVPAQENDDGPGLLTRIIQDRLSDVSREVRIVGFEGALSSRATIERLIISDVEGVWFEATDLALDWDRGALFGGRIDVDALTAGEISILRPPIPEPGVDLPEPEARDFALPDLPVSIEIDRLDAERIELGEAFLGEAVSLSVEGEVALADGEGTAEIVARRIDGETGVFAIEGAFSNETRVLSLDLLLDEGPDGIVAELLDIPGRPPLRLSVEGTAPLEDYEAEIALATDGQERLTGQVALSTVREGEAPEGELPPATRAFAVDLGGDVTSLLAPDYRDFFGDRVRLVAEGVRRPDGSLRLPEFSLEAEAITLAGSLELGPGGWPERFVLTGQVGADEAGPVLLPVPGERTYVDTAAIALSYDAEAGNTWTGDALLRGYERPGVRIPELQLDGGGVIEQGDDGTGRRATADLDFGARGIVWQDTALARAIGPDLSGTLEVLFEEDAPTEIEILTLEAPGLSGQGEAVIDGAQVAFSTAARVEDLGRFSDLAGQDLGGSGAVTLSGSAHVLDRAFDVTLTADTQDLSVGIEQVDPLLAGEGRVRFAAVRDQAGTRVEELSVTTPEVSAEGSAVLTSGASDIDLRARVEDVGVVLDDLEGPAALVLDAVRRDDGVTELKLAADMPQADLTLDATATPQEEGFAVAGRLTGEVAALAPFSELAGRDLEGAAALDVSGRFDTGTRDFDVEVSARTQDLGLGIEQVDPLLGGAGTLTLSAARTQEALTVDAFRLSTEAVEASGEAVVAEGETRAAFDARLADIGVAVAELSGPARVQGTARQGPEGATLVEATATAPGVDLGVDARVAPAAEDYRVEGTVTGEVASLAPYSGLAGRDLAGSAELTLSGMVNPVSRDFDVDLSARTRDLALGIDEVDPLLDGSGSFSVSAARSGDAVTVDAFRVETAAVAASGEAAMGEDGRVSGTVRADVATLAPFSGLAGRDLSGAAELTLTGEADPETLTFDVELAAATRDVAVGIDRLDPLLDGAGTLTLSAARTQAALTVERFELSTPQVTASGEAVIAQGETRAELDALVEDLGLVVPGLSGPARLDATAQQGPRGATRIEALVTAPGARAQLDATVAPEGANYETAGTLEARIADIGPYARLVGQDASGSVQLVASGTALPAEGVFDVEIDATTTDLAAGPEAVGRLLRGTGEVSAEIARDAEGRITLESARVDFPNVSGTADLAVRNGTERLGFDLRLRDIGLFTDDFSGPVTAEGTAIRQNGTIRLDVDATGPGGTAAAIDGTVGPGGRLDLDAEGQAPLGLANTFIDPRRLSGTAEFDLSIAGRPGLGALSGTVTTSGARLSEPRLGRALENIDATVQITNGRAQVALSGDVTEGGRIEVTGPLALTPPFRGDLTVALDDVVIQDPRLYRTVADGTLSIDGPLTGGAAIAGQIDLEETDIRVPSSDVGPLGPLPDVRHVDPPADVSRTLARARISVLGGPEAAVERGGPRPAFPLDITIDAENRIFVRGRGLDAELGGQLRIRGTTRNVIPSGRFELIRGRLDILQQRFELSEGFAQLQGDFTPVLRLVATTETAGGTTVSIIVEGPVTEPEVSFVSAPELPQDEVLARLIFDRDLSELSPLQAVQLASAVGTLAGRGGGGLLDDLRVGLGLDDLDITADEEGNAAVRLGAYLSENVYTDVTVTSEGETQIDLNLDVTDAVTAKGSFTSEGESAIGIFFERDY